MSGVPREIQVRHISNCLKADPAYGAGVARALGIERFGAFAMVLAYVQAVGNLVQFQSWQLVIRFGAGHLQNDRIDRLETLVRFGTWLDVASALVSALIGVIGVWFLDTLLGWSEETAWSAQLFSLALIGWMRATPTGILRLFDRFDLVSWSEMLTPAIRFVGAILAVAVMPTMEAFLAIWAISEIAAAILLWWMAARCLRQHGGSIRPGWPRGVVSDNPRLWNFAWSSNATASVNLVWQQLGTLAVGGSLGPAAAGGFRLAFQLAQALSKPALLLGRVIYPEFARLYGQEQFSRILQSASVVAALAGVSLVCITALFGKAALTLIAGAEYGEAAPLLTILSAAVAIDLAGFALEPALLASGRAGRALLARAAGATVYVGLLFILIERLGAFGAAWAGVWGSMIALGAALLFIFRDSAPALP